MLQRLYFFFSRKRQFATCICDYTLFLFFFFSSRRRHTRCLSDWSSDVCSSDLFAAVTSSRSLPVRGSNDHRLCTRSRGPERRNSTSPPPRGMAIEAGCPERKPREIGRASCRERV